MILKTADFIAKHLNKFVLLIAIMCLTSYTDLVALPDESKAFLGDLSLWSIFAVIGMGVFFVGVTCYRIHMLSEDPEFDRVK